MKVNSQTITSPIQCAANTEYDCTGSVLTRNSGGWVFVIPNGVNGVTIKGGEFIGGGVKTDSTDGSRIEGITVRGTTNAGDGDTGGHSSAISCMGSFTNGRIANNKIYKASGTAIFLFGGLHETKVARNLVDTANEGIHWFGRGGPTNRNPEFTYNSILRCRRHGIELQCYGKTYGLIIRKNYCGEWITTPSWNGHMPFSIAMGGRQSRIEEDKGPGPYINEGMIVEDNVADTSGDLLEKFLNGTTPWRNTVAYELMGDGFIFRNNFSNGFAHSTLVEYVGPGWTMYDNIFLSHSDKVLIKNGGSGDQQSEVTQGVGYNSGPLRMDNFLGVIGEKPVPAAGYLADLGPIPTPPPTPTPTPTPTTMFKLTPTQLTDRTVKFASSDLPAGTVNVRVISISTVGREPGPTVNLPIGGDGIGSGYSPNWRYDFSGFAEDANKKVLALSNVTKGFQVKAPTGPPVPTPTPTTFTVLQGTPDSLKIPVTNGVYDFTKATKA